MVNTVPYISKHDFQFYILSDQIMCFTSELYLVTPFINNPLVDVVQPEDYACPLYCNY